MKYSVEVIDDGYVETLTIEEKEYKKTWIKACYGHYKCKDYEFYEQLEADGCEDEEFLDKICDDIDNSSLANDFYSAYECLMGCE